MKPISLEKEISSVTYPGRGIVICFRQQPSKWGGSGRPG